MSSEETGLIKLAEQAKAVTDIEFQFAAQMRGAAPKWTYKDQQHYAQKLLEVARAKTLDTDTVEKFFETALPNTKWGILVNFRKLTGWLGAQLHDFFEDRSDEAGKLIERAIEPTEEACLRLRGPGGMLFPLLKPKNGETWESHVGLALTKPTGPQNEAQKFNTADLKELGRTIAASYGLKEEDITRECSLEADTYVFTYHHEPLDPEHGYHGHCCGAHANDTHRGVMSAIAQAALLTWATNGTKKVSIQGRRTATPKREAALLDPSQTDYQRFKQDFFIGDVPENAEELLKAGGKLFPKGVERPSLEWAFNAIRDINLSNPLQKGEKIAVISCADDRLGLRLDEEKGLQVSQVPEHTSNIMYVSVGRRALSIMNRISEAPGVYRDTVAAGAKDISIEDMPAIESQMLQNVPLILQNVMSPDEPHKKMFVDIVVGAESADWAENGTVKDENTLKILMSPAVRRMALPKLAEQDPPINLTVAQLDKAIVERRLPREIVEVFIREHEELVFNKLNETFIADGKLYDKLKTEFAKQQGNKGKSISLNFRIIRVADRSVGYRRFGRDEATPLDK